MPGMLARGPATAGGWPRPRDPHATDSARDPRSVSWSESREGEQACGCRRRGRRRAVYWGRELENAVRAGGRLASGLGLRSATTEMPFLRLPEQSAPGRSARGYKWGGAAGWGGGRTRLPRVTPGEGGRKRLKASRGGGGGGGGKGEEMEKSVSGEFIERGSEGRALQRVETDKADAVSQPLASSCNPRGPRVKQVFPGRSVCASLDSPGAEGP